jgi:hypothetical protein
MSDENLGTLPPLADTKPKSPTSRVRHVPKTYSEGGTIQRKLKPDSSTSQGGTIQKKLKPDSGSRTLARTDLSDSDKERKNSSAQSKEDALAGRVLSDPQIAARTSVGKNPRSSTLKKPKNSNTLKSESDESNAESNEPKLKKGKLSFIRRSRNQTPAIPVPANTERNRNSTSEWSSVSPRKVDLNPSPRERERVARSYTDAEEGTIKSPKRKESGLPQVDSESSISTSIDVYSDATSPRTQPIRRKRQRDKRGNWSMDHNEDVHSSNASSLPSTGDSVPDIILSSGNDEENKS